MSFLGKKSNPIINTSRIVRPPAVALQHFYCFKVLEKSGYQTHPHRYVARLRCTRTFNEHTGVVSRGLVAGALGLSGGTYYLFRISFVFFTPLFPLPFNWDGS